MVLLQELKGRRGVCRSGELRKDLALWTLSAIQDLGGGMNAYYSHPAAAVVEHLSRVRCFFGGPLARAAVARGGRILHGEVSLFVRA